MVEEDEFFERRGIEFAVGAEFERDLRHSRRFARGVNPERVGFHFRDAGDGVVDRGQEERHRGHDEHEERQARWIGDTSHAPGGAPALEGRFKGPLRERENNERE